MSGTGVRVLVAEDDKLNRIMISKLLEKYGAVCTSAEDGSEALEFFSENEFDIVLLDNNMPGYSGPECAEHIKRHCEENNIKKPLLIGISADESMFDEELFDDFLPKPFKIEKVVAILEMVK